MLALVGFLLSRKGVACSKANVGLIMHDERRNNKKYKKHASRESPIASPLKQGTHATRQRRGGVGAIIV